MGGIQADRLTGALLGDNDLMKEGEKREAEGKKQQGQCRRALARLSIFAPVTLMLYLPTLSQKQMPDFLLRVTAHESDGSAITYTAESKGGLGFGFER